MRKESGDPAWTGDLCMGEPGLPLGHGWDTATPRTYW